MSPIRFRPSVRVGPFRVSLGRRGIGYSVGGRGFRTGVGSGGRRYTTFSLPGTGVSVRKGGGCLLAALAIGIPALLAW